MEVAKVPVLWFCGLLDLKTLAKTTREVVDTLSHETRLPLTHSLFFIWDGTGSWEPSLTEPAGPQAHYSGSGFLQRGEHPLTVTSR